MEAEKSIKTGIEAETRQEWKRKENKNNNTSTFDIELRMKEGRIKAKEVAKATLRFLSFPALVIISLIVLIDVIAWIAATIISTAVLSYTPGLQHALDADHISAIDFMTRRLVATGSKPVIVGTWFSPVHSTIVNITCLVVAATSGDSEEHFEGFRNVGGVIDTSVRAAILILLGIGNGCILYKLVQWMRGILRGQDDDGRDTVAQEVAAAGLDLQGALITVRLFNKVFNFINHLWKMVPLRGEIAVLRIASVEGAKGTIGMCLIDTADEALMTLCTSVSLTRDTIAILCYPIVLTVIAVLIAIASGTIQLLSLIKIFSAPFMGFVVLGGSVCSAMQTVAQNSCSPDATSLLQKQIH
ncbi:high-affinity nickel-transport protein-domain-containing protein [Amylocarpus encephaloides]|uniref:Nickel/cobalt efflux system n=1 Tax=Amylocarpus encephaloides TaxID=45428 RepID=A0A9P7Y954_9HELO|nr:high-affinity nickel-transport protein-domain-containing protein [Amylocarpus encephaloides]